MLKPFLEYLDENVVVCDGAMGTQLYARGVFLNRCFDELNLSQPALVREVHQEYLWAGAEILETNTFGANRLKLEPHGLAERVREINLAGMRLARGAAGESAYVAGSIGPLGVRVEPYGRLGIEEARSIFREQVSAMADGGVDLISLETFSDLNELHAAILAVRDIGNLPIMAQVTLQEDGNSLDGTPPEDFGPRLVEWGADVVGSNCGVGPQAMLECIERIAQVVNCRLAAQPNAGRPRNFEGRNLYLSSPEYFASYAKRFIRAGVRVVGGCCGTTPAHIKAICDAVRAQAAPVPRPLSSPQSTAPGALPVPAVETRSRFAERLTAGRPVAVVDLPPQPGVAVEGALRAARLLESRGVNGICVSDAPAGSACMTVVAMAALLGKDLRTELVLRLSCRNRSLLTMQSELLGMYALGIRNVILTTGEPLRVGEFIDATAVLDADQVGVAHLLRRLSEGRDLGGKSIGDPAAFYVGVTVDAAAPDPEHEIRALERKLAAGAHFAVTEPIYDARLAGDFLARIRGLRIPLISCVRPLVNWPEAEMLRNEIAGPAIPDSVVARMREAGSPEQEQLEGLRIAREITRALREMVQGVLVMSRAGSPDPALQLLGL